ncbi:MAG: hypothetical protein J6J17_05705 [Bacilli bacterium]|nr:hypothetical protein [Bacilli bacterium]
MIQTMYAFWHRDKEKRVVIEEIGIYNQNFKSVIYKFDYSNKYLDEVNRMMDIFYEVKQKVENQEKTSLKQLIYDNKILFINTSKYENKEDVDIIKNDFIVKMQKNSDLLLEIDKKADYFTSVIRSLGSSMILCSINSFKLLMVNIMLFTPLYGCFEYLISELRPVINEEYNKNKIKFKIRKSLLKIHLMVNIVLFLHAGYKNINPFITHDKNNLTEYQIEEYINEAIDKNREIIDSDKEILKEISEYALKSDYINYKELYNDLSDIEIENIEKILYNEETCSYICASYIDLLNKVEIYESDMPRDTALLHEVIHSTGDFESTFLNEGMTALLEREYYENNDSVDAYDKNVNTIRLLCELVGSDVVLKSYNEKKDDILYEALSKIYGTKEEARKFILNLDNYSRKLAYEEKCAIFNNFYYYIDSAVEKGIIKRGSDNVYDCNHYLNNIINGHVIDIEDLKYYFNVDDEKVYKLNR